RRAAARRGAACDDRQSAGREVRALLERAPARRAPRASDALRALRGGGRVTDRRMWLALVAAVTVLVLDQVTKAIVARSMTLYETIPLLPFFSLTYVRNTGAAFGLLGGLP